ncbi:aldo/keto reductase [Streptacidiphilus fuscans]|uniref:Aldo/keto reductase n=1 Tax=Streptacidiphilus fuscans TaxID=2789292 RepID=A0A931BBF4_9ACTN|nr:aldo/keto reductase [Streptacidiphilus fuscans]MBF9073102.1 aldo/keto reductase [Streptacidiphilus fuscans]
MDYTSLGRTGLSVSRLCLGTMNFGPHTEEADAHQIMDNALDEGINFFDTANVYGWGENKGRTESIIGSWFGKGGARRERTVLATKLNGEMPIPGYAGSDWPNTNKLSALNIRRACDASLKRLGTDYIDVYQMHHVDRATPWDEIWQAMEVLVQQGKILYVGSSNFAGWHIATAQGAAARRNYLGLVAEQSLYNLMTRTVELEVLPSAQYHGLGVIPWSPLQGGLLGGVLRKAANEGVRGAERLARLDEAQIAQLRQWEEFCDKLGAEPGTVALAWLLHQPAVTAPIIGPRTDGQLTTALAALELSLDADALAELDRIFPGHKPAPEDYAW